MNSHTSALLPHRDSFHSVLSISTAESTELLIATSLQSQLHAKYWTSINKLAQRYMLSSVWLIMEAVEQWFPTCVTSGFCFSAAFLPCHNAIEGLAGFGDCGPRPPFVFLLLLLESPLQLMVQASLFWLKRILMLLVIQDLLFGNWCQYFFLVIQCPNTVHVALNYSVKISFAVVEPGLCTT